MNIPSLPIISLLVATTLVTGAAWAEKPEWAGQGKGGKHSQADDGGGKKHKNDKMDKPPAVVAADVRVGAYFGEPQRVVVREYYTSQYRAGHCPPGLAKKNNGCMPPGQAKKWAVGQPLPRDVIYYPVPQSVVVRLGAPPAGHKYVRVASDILLIAIGSSMIVDAIQDLGGI
jgi:Ni/Co efflux regulator RcnB